MKLLYVWIEEFRNIRQQGFIVDNEYTITVESPDSEDVKYVDSHKSEIAIHGHISRLARKIYMRKLRFSRNELYESSEIHNPIKSITALVGENASGKSSIIECLQMRADQSNYANKECRYYLLVFYDEGTDSVVIRTRDIWLTNHEERKMDKRIHRGYDEYVIPLSLVVDSPQINIDDNITTVSIYQNNREDTEWAYPTLGMIVNPVNLYNSNSRNAFSGIFDFLCAFPMLGGEDNRLVLYLDDEHSREKSEYFTIDGKSPEEYKETFVYMLAKCLFGALRDYLYHEKPEYVMSGDRIRRPEEETLHKENIECAEILSFCNISYPRNDSMSLSRTTHSKNHLTDGLANAIAFFKQSTYVYSGKIGYNRYLNMLEEMFNNVLSIEPECFTAFYKLEIPFNEKYRGLISSVKNCLDNDEIEKNWCKSLTVDFEWFSTGEYQRAILFSGLYQRLIDKDNSSSVPNLILVLDEPEMHMHPESGRKFIDYLEEALILLKQGGVFSTCQIIMATHSPFIIETIKKFSNTIVLVKKHKNQILIEDFVDLKQLTLPDRDTYSFPLVMYKVFGVPTVELHNELYGSLQETNQHYTTSSLDEWIKVNLPEDCVIPKIWIKVKKDNTQVSESVTLQTYIRNSIHHPENSLNKKYNEQEIETSIEQMLRLIINATSSTNEVVRRICSDFF